MANNLNKKLLILGDHNFGRRDSLLITELLPSVFSGYKVYRIRNTQDIVRVCRRDLRDYSHVLVACLTNCMLEVKDDANNFHRDERLGGEFQSVLDELEGLMESNPDLSMTLLPPIEYMGGDAPPFYQDLENLDEIFEEWEVENQYCTKLHHVSVLRGMFEPNLINLLPEARSYYVTSILVQLNKFTQFHGYLFLDENGEAINDDDDNNDGSDDDGIEG